MSTFGCCRKYRPLPFGVIHHYSYKQVSAFSSRLEYVRSMYMCLKDEALFPLFSFPSMRKSVKRFQPTQTGAAKAIMKCAGYHDMNETCIHLSDIEHQTVPIDHNTAKFSLQRRSVRGILFIGANFGPWVIISPAHGIIRGTASLCELQRQRRVQHRGRNTSFHNSHVQRRTSMNGER